METALVKSLADIEHDTEAVWLGERVNQKALDAAALEITDQRTLMQANDIRIELKELEKQLDTRRKFFVDPHNQFVKTINAWFKSPLDAVSMAINTVNRGMSAYDDKVRAAAEAARLKILADQRTLPETKSEKLATIEKPPEVIESAMGKTTFRIDKKLEIFDIDELYRGFVEMFLDRPLTSAELVRTKRPEPIFVPDEKTILAALKEGIEIPGARIIEVKTPVIGRGNF